MPRFEQRHRDVQDEMIEWRGDSSKFGIVSVFLAEISKSRNIRNIDHSMGSPSSMDSNLQNGGPFSFNNHLANNNTGDNFSNTGDNFSQTSTNPASTAMGAHMHNSSGWQSGLGPGLGPSSFQQPQSHPADLSLGQLLVMYPAAQQLHDKWADAQSKILLALETQSALVKDNMRLTNELREVTASRRLES